MGVLRTLVTSALMGTAGSARAGTGVAELAVRRGPSLVTLGARAVIGSGADAARAQAAFRDELLTLFDDGAEIVWRQARWARNELDERTSPRDDGAATAAHDGAPPRRHRVKA